MKREIFYLDSISEATTASFSFTCEFMKN